MVTTTVHETLPELDAFVHAARSRRPDAGTWCEAWTTRDILIHQAGNAEEMARVLAGHLAGTPVQTRGFEEREAPIRALDDSDLWAAFDDRCERLTEVCQAGESALSPDEQISWTGRIVTPAFFAEHMREELVLHRWDLAGDDATAVRALAEPWTTTHTVHLVGKPLLRRGATGLDLAPGQRIEGRLRAPGSDDVVVTAGAEGATIALAKPEGPATIESDPAVRTLFLWGRRPADFTRWHSTAGPEELRNLRTLLSGY
jgi:Mycothiol maleylpyruvate isomerase N-terminal domain